MKRAAKICLIGKIVLVLLMGFSTKGYSQNFMVNGDFESGNTAINFQIPSYTLLTPPYAGNMSEGQCAITTNPANANTGFISSVDHTSGSGNMLVVNTSSNIGQLMFWKTLPGAAGICGLTPGTKYSFSYWIKSVSTAVINFATRAEIGVNITNAGNISMVRGTRYAPLPAEGWKKVTYDFMATSSCVDVEMWNFQLGTIGNDFAIDDMSVVVAPCEYEPTITVTQPNCASATGTIVIDGPLTAIRSVNELFISEVTDENAGLLTYIEIFNGTSFTKNLGDYKIKVYYNGSATAGCDIHLNGNLARGGTYVLAIGSGTNVGGVVPDQVEIGCGGVGISDNIRLTFTDNNEIDVWGRTDGVSFTPSNQPGYTYRRKNTSSMPNTSWFSGDWTAIDPQDYSDIRSYTLFTDTYEYSVDGINYQASRNFNTLPPANYTVVAHNTATSCYSASADVAMTAFVRPDGGTDKTLNCYTTDAATMSATGIGTWIAQTSPPNPGTAIIANPNSPTTQISNFSTAGTYVFLWKDANNCYDAVSVNAGSACPCPVMPGIALSAPNGNACTAIPFTLSGNTFANVSNVSITENGAGSISAGANATASPFSFTYNPDAADAGNQVTFTMTSNDPDGTGPCAAATSTFVLNVGTAGLTVTNPPSVCSGSNVDLTASAVTSGTTTIGMLSYWKDNNATIPLPMANAVAVGGTYYIKNTIGICSQMMPVVVSIIPVPSPQIVLNLAYSQTLSTTTSAYFDWNDMPGATNYNYTYTIQGQPPVSGTTAVSNFTVTVSGPGIKVDFSIIAVVGSPCTVGESTFGFSRCPVIATPNFTNIELCSGMPVPLLSATSPNGITGAWSPSAINNTASADYEFTPTVPCTEKQTIHVNVTPMAIAVFNAMPDICQGSIPPVLPTVSQNNPPLSGTWNVPISTTAIGTRNYYFTPNAVAGKCIDLNPVTFSVNVVPVVNTSFPPIAPVCYGETVPVLPATSLEGINGTWLPATIDNTTSKTYRFTPNAGQCGTMKDINVTIIQKLIPDFAPIAPICNGDAVPVLSTTSPNGLVTGTWNPSAIDNTESKRYLFTPTPGLCAASQELFVTITQPDSPGFEDEIEICEGTVAPLLLPVSPLGITGSWVPTVIDNLNDADYVFTPDAGQCVKNQTVSVKINRETLINVKYIATAFDENQVVTVIASNAGNYLYQLDNGHLQESNIFENVGVGSHSIRVVDKNGCSNPIVINNVQVINFPKFFTPNGDGINDTWTIKGFERSMPVKVKLFDRFGKFMLDMETLQNGWDGTLNGKLMPATDYWFTIEYIEEQVPKIFKSHFSLKR